MEVPTLSNNDTADLNTKFKKNAVLYFWPYVAQGSGNWVKNSSYNLVSFHLTLRFAA